MLTRLWSCWSSWLWTCWSLAFPADFSLEPDLVAAEKYAQHFAPDPATDYRWVYEYAMDDYRRANEALSALEAKADTYVTYFSGMVVVLALGAFVMNAVEGRYLLPGLGLGTVCVLMALHARRVMPEYAPPDVERAAAYAEWGDREAGWPETNAPKGQAAFTAQWRSAAIGQNLLVDYKAHLLRWTGYLFPLALLGTLLPIAHALWILEPEASSTVPQTHAIPRERSACEPSRQSSRSSRDEGQGGRQFQVEAQAEPEERVQVWAQAEPEERVQVWAQAAPLTSSARPSGHGPWASSCLLPIRSLLWHSTPTAQKGQSKATEI